MTERDPLELAARALRHRDRSRRDVDARLARAGVAAQERDEALEALERIGYVDDARFARARAATLAERGYGDAAIRADLEGQGADAAAVEEALAALAPEPERARALFARVGRSPRTAAQLARKGFSPDTLEELLGSADEWGDGGGADDR